MKMFLYAGLILTVLGIASLVVPLPSSEKQGIKIGDTYIGVQTNHSEKVSPVVSAVLIAGDRVEYRGGASEELSFSLSGKECECVATGKRPTPRPLVLAA